MIPIPHSFNYSLDYLREQVADISTSDLVKQPSGLPNHPAWVIGHLTYTCEMLGGAIGLEPWLPEHWGGRYGSGSKPADDAQKYETKQNLLEILADAQARITRAVAGLDE